VSLPEDVAKMEEEFAEVVRGRGPDFKYFQVTVRLEAWGQSHDF
jgi:hypothetical protein